MHPQLRRRVLMEARRSAPYAALLAVALGVVVTVGANLSTAFPSEKAPYGWPGVAGFENAVAMVRGDLVLAASLPAVLCGAMALRGARRTRDLPIAFGVDAAMLTLACFVGATIGSIGAARTPIVAFVAFSVAHAILALSFYSLAFLCAALVRNHALPVAMGAWLVFNAAYEGIVRTNLFRQYGYFRLAAGEFPTWFFAAQALSPLSAYRGILILWDRKFMDYIENAALGKAVLPSWVNPLTFSLFALAFWVLLPLGLAMLAWWWRTKRASASARASAEAT